VSQARKRLLVDLLILVAIVVPLAWIAATVYPWLNVPGRAMSLEGTSWRVVEIDGQPPATESSPAIRFDEDGLSATVWTGCRDGTIANYWLDTDDSGLNFAPVEMSPGAACPERSRAGESAFLDALLDVEEWSIENSNRIHFGWAHEIVLERQS
jgi:heat shock protein HslJ